MLKNFSFLILLIFTNLNLYSQTDPVNKTKGNFKPDFDDGKISGYIYDRQSKTPLEGVSVQLIKARVSSLYKGAETDAAGYFSLENIEQGKYNLLISLVGYNNVRKAIDLVQSGEKIITLDTIFLKSGTETEEIVVEAEKPFLELKGEKKVFNVGQNMNVTGGTALEVLKNLPSVTVDLDNNVSLRGGQQIKFYINGRPVTGNVSRILEQLPADQLSQVEVITNPSAKYEAESSTGVINLVMKKYDDSGFNGELNLNAGTGDKYGSGLNLNYKKGKFKLSGSYDYRMRNMDFTGSLLRNNYLVPSDAFSDQSSNGTMKMNGNNARAELEYNISPSDILNLNYRYNNGDRTRNDTENLLVYDQSNVLNQSSITTNTESENNEEYSVGLNYNRIFKSKKESLSGEASFSYDKDYENETKVTKYSLPLDTPDLNSLINGQDLTKEVNAQTDYTKPLGRDLKIETGLKYNYRNTNANSFYYNQNNKTGVYEIDSLLTDEFIFAENIGGVYAMFGDEGGSFTYNLGLRGEYWDYNLNQYDKNSETSRSSINIFPSATITQKLGSTEEVSLSFSRRVRRPGFRQLSPIVMVVSPILYRKGNPDLGSEYINSVELNFAKFFTSFSLIPSVFYKLTTDKITSYSQLIDSNITLNTSINSESEVSYGAELLVNGSFTRDLSLNGSLSFYNQELNSDSLASNSNTTFAGRLFANYNLPWDMGVQLTYFYSGKMLTSQGEVKPVSSFDIGFRKDFMDKKLSLNLRASDIFNAVKMSGTTTTETYTQQFNRQRESRVVSLTLAYKFGDTDKTKDRKKRKPSEQQENNDDSDF